MDAQDKEPQPHDGDPSDIWVGMFRLAAGYGAEYELRLRLLADKTPAIAHTSMGEAVETEDAIIAHFASHLQPGEADAMRATRQLRNKLLHIDLIKVGSKLGQLGHAPGEPIVRKVKLDPTGDLVAQLFAAAENAKYLAPDTDPIQGNIFGWFLQCGADGTFERAVQSFRAAIVIVNRLRDVP